MRQKLCVAASMASFMLKMHCNDCECDWCGRRDRYRAGGGASHEIRVRTIFSKMCRQKYVSKIFL